MHERAILQEWWHL